MPPSLGVSCRLKLASSPSLIPRLLSELQPAECRSNPRSRSKRSLHQSNIRSWLYGIKSQILYFHFLSLTCDSVITKSKRSFKNMNLNKSPGRFSILTFKGQNFRHKYTKFPCLFQNVENCYISCYQSNRQYSKYH